MTQNDIDLQEAEELLPWYLNGSLSAEERARVEQALEAEPALKAELAALESLSEAVVESSNSVAVPASDFDLVMQQIDGVEAAPVAARAEPAGLSLLESFRSLFAMPAMRFAAVAAALVVMVQSAAIVGLLVQAPGEGVGYETATGPQPVEATAAGPRLLVMFQPEAGLAEFATLIGEIDGSIVEGPSQEGAFIVEIAPDADVDAAIQKLQASEDLVRFAGKAS